MIVLYEQHFNRKEKEMEFLAAIHGVKLGGNSISSSSTSVGTPESQFKFGSKEDYAKMSVEKRKELTKKMKSFHKGWSGQSEVGEGRKHAK